MVGIAEEGKDSSVPYHGFMYSCFTTKNLASATKKGLDTRGICPRYHTIHHNTSSNDHVTLESYVRFVALYACLYPRWYVRADWAHAVVCKVKLAPVFPSSTVFTVAEQIPNALPMPMKLHAHEYPCPNLRPERNDSHLKHRSLNIYQLFLRSRVLWCSLITRLRSLGAVVHRASN
jgi:hypothetical protein